MKIFSFFESEEQEYWTEKIRACDWGAAKLLYDILKQNKFKDMLDGKLFIMADGAEFVSFCTLTKRDCVDDDSLFPWIGFVFTAPEYRGHRYSGEIIDYAFREAKNEGFRRVYLATDHIGLYEKYGFKYIETRTDIYNDKSRIYFREED